LLLCVQSLEETPDQASDLHLLKLSPNRRALLWEDLGSSRSGTVPLLNIVAVRAMRKETTLELAYLDDEEDWEERVLSLVGSTQGDRDVMLAGFKLMVKEARKRYELGARMVRKAVLRHYLGLWRAQGRLSY
jgi:hypothetical protein